MMIWPFDFGALVPTLATAAVATTASASTSPIRHTLRLIRSPFLASLKVGIPAAPGSRLYSRCERGCKRLQPDLGLLAVREVLVAGLVVAAGAPEDGDHRDRLVGVVPEAVPLAARDVDHVALVLAHGLALAQVEPRPLQHVQRLLRVRMPVQVVRLAGRELRDVEDDARRARPRAVDEPPDVEPLPPRTAGHRRVLGRRRDRALLHQVPPSAAAWSAGAAPRPSRRYSATAETSASPNPASPAARRTSALRRACGSSAPTSSARPRINSRSFSASASRNATGVSSGRSNADRR